MTMLKVCDKDYLLYLQTVDCDKKKLIIRFYMIVNFPIQHVNQVITNLCDFLVRHAFAERNSSMSSFGLYERK